MIGSLSEGVELDVASLKLEGSKPKRRQQMIKAKDLLVPFEEALSLLAKAGYVNVK